MKRTHRNFKQAPRSAHRRWSAPSSGRTLQICAQVTFVALALSRLAHAQESLPEKSLAQYPIQLPAQADIGVQQDERAYLSDPELGFLEHASVEEISAWMEATGLLSTRDAAEGDTFVNEDPFDPARYSPFNEQPPDASSPSEYFQSPESESSDLSVAASEGSDLPDPSFSEGSEEFTDSGIEVGNPELENLITSDGTDLEDELVMSTPFQDDRPELETPLPEDTEQLMCSVDAPDDTSGDGLTEGIESTEPADEVADGVGEAGPEDPEVEYTSLLAAGDTPSAASAAKKEAEMIAKYNEFALRTFVYRLEEQRKLAKKEKIKGFVDYPFLTLAMLATMDAASSNAGTEIDADNPVRVALMKNAPFAASVPKDERPADSSPYAFVRNRAKIDAPGLKFKSRILVWVRNNLKKSILSALEEALDITTLGRTAAGFKVPVAKATLSAIEKASKYINDEVSKATGGRVKAIVNPTSLGNSVLAIVAAMEMTGTFETTFEKDLKCGEKFFGVNGTSKADYFHGHMMVARYQDSAVRAIRLRLARTWRDGRSDKPVPSGTLIIITPKDPKTTLAPSHFGRTAAFLIKSNFRGAKYERVNLFVPKFSISDEYEPLAALQAQGFGDLFKGLKSDHLRHLLSGSYPLEVKMKQKTTLELTRNGFHGAGAAATLFNPRSEPEVVKLDRQLYFIALGPTDEITMTAYKPNM